MHSVVPSRVSTYSCLMHVIKGCDAHVIGHDLPAVVEHSNLDVQLLGGLQIRCKVQVQALCNESGRILLDSLHVDLRIVGQQLVEFHRTSRRGR